jgi:hypothetical protein
MKSIKGASVILMSSSLNPFKALIKNSVESRPTPTNKKSKRKFKTLSRALTNISAKREPIKFKSQNLKTIPFRPLTIHIKPKPIVPSQQKITIATS